MPFTSTLKKAIIRFPSLVDLSNFKHDCACADFYVDRDALTLVGSFTEEQLQIANYSYGGMYKIDDAA